MTTIAPVFYDCEASCIGGLPIEIGWAVADLATGEINSESHLVNPPVSWDMQSMWDPDAEKLHKISRNELIARGKPPFEIARRMNESLVGRELFSDKPADDERWLRILFDEAGLPPAFTLRRVHADERIAELALETGWDRAGYEIAKSEALRAAPRKHRAEADARHLAMLWLIIARGRVAR